MATVGRVTVTLAIHLLEEIDRVERNRSRFIAEAVEQELNRRRRETLLRSIATPHPETTELVDAAPADWAKDPPAEGDLVDLSAGTAVDWVNGQGWVTGPV